MGVEDHRRRALDFLHGAHLYRLGDLPTEQPHPDTRELADWARGDLPRALSALRRIDLGALDALREQSGPIDGLAAAARATLAAGHRVFLCGCGATGRLALSLESFWRRAHPGRDRVRAFMAGGDVALVHALEGFEDHAAFGARHLRELGFADGDLLIACTEGGETSYVIGATEQAADRSSTPPYFLYCNTDSALLDRVERFRRVHDDARIRKLCLYVGPMALAGSTRMQASTVLQLAVGLALLHPDEPAGPRIAEFRRRVRSTDLSFLERFVEREADVYGSGHHVVYRVRDFGITVLTDTTERAPTFSLVPFDQLLEPRPQHSLCYVSLEDSESAADAWLRLLHRRPRALNWPEVDPRTSPGYLEGFDFSARALERRRQRIPDKTQHEFRIHRDGGAIAFRLGELAHDLPVGALPELFQQLLLKLILNAHSTLVMGRLGRYESNLMTWVSPTNGKLVDRAVRCVQHLLAHAGRPDVGYERIVHRLFAEMDGLEPGESVVLRTYRSLSNGELQRAAG